MAKLYTATETAERFRTDAKTLRIFLRSDAKANGRQAPGKGSRWAIDLEAGALNRRFRAWKTARAEAKAAAEAKLQEADQAIQEAEIAEADADMEANFGEDS